MFLFPQKKISVRFFINSLFYAFIHEINLCLLFLGGEKMCFLTESPEFKTKKYSTLKFLIAKTKTKVKLFTFKKHGF